MSDLESCEGGDEEPLREPPDERIKDLEAENRRFSSIVRSVQQEINFLRHVAEDPGTNPDRAEGLRQWCGLIQACLDGAPPATGAGESDGGNQHG